MTDEHSCFAPIAPPETVVVNVWWPLRATSASRGRRMEYCVIRSFRRLTLVSPSLHLIYIELRLSEINEKKKEKKTKKKRNILASNFFSISFIIFGSKLKFPSRLNLRSRPKATTAALEIPKHTPSSICVNHGFYPPSCVQFTEPFLFILLSYTIHIFSSYTSDSFQIKAKEEKKGSFEFLRTPPPPSP